LKNRVWCPLGVLFPFPVFEPHWRPRRLFARISSRTENLAMPRSRTFGFGRVNLIKKVKVDGEWKFCPAVVEQGKKLNDLVRVKGKIETHNEGTYYLEWRERGKRRREPVRNRALVFEQARLKALELEGQAKPSENPTPHVSHDSAPAVPQPVSTPLITYRLPLLGTAPPPVEMPGATLIWRGIESFFQQIIGAAVRSELQSLGVIPEAASAANEPARVSELPSHAGEQATTKSASPNGGIMIAEAIKSYLK